MDLQYLQELAKFGKYHEINNIVMTDTKEFCESNGKLIDSIDNSINTCLIVYEEDNVKISPKSGNTQIIVSKERSYEAAKKYKGKKIAVLDFANNHNPGGAPYRAGAQEESMCRCSTLYPCLFGGDNYELFYQKHIDLYDHGEIDFKGNDDLIYFHDITVFKTDEDIPQLMDEKDWYNVDVIVSAAPELNSGNMCGDKELEYVLIRRIKRILDIAYHQKAEVLILGAYGCGAFNNPPQLVAKTFKEQLKNYDFQTVEFAVFCRDDNPTSNYQIFKNVILSDNNTVNLSRFIEAQDAVYPIVVKELQGGKKQSHWMWYIFPQIKGLGYSEKAKYYAIENLDEAKAYYEHELLGKRLKELCNILINLETNNPEEIFGGIDALKLHSCMTLFLQIDNKCEEFRQVIQKFYNGNLDQNTLNLVKIDGK